MAKFVPVLTLKELHAHNTRGLKKWTRETQKWVKANYPKWQIKENKKNGN